jgi:hypothetical protein
VLRTLTNLKMAAATNYPLGPEQVERLAALWSRTGHDWTRDESVAGLWAYARTSGGSVSRLPGVVPSRMSPCASGEQSVGVYNKVMNFRHLDPRDEREGMSGGGAADARVWDEFSDKMAGQLRVDELEAEFSRLWRYEGAVAGADSELQNETLTEAAHLLEQRLSASCVRLYGRNELFGGPPHRAAFRGRRRRTV